MAGKSKQEFITTKKAAEVLDVSIATVRRYIKSKKLTAHKIGREYRIKNSDIDRLLDPTSFSNKKKRKNSSEMTIEKQIKIKVIPGINSMVSEALAELINEIKSIKELEKIAKELDGGETLPLIDKVKSAGVRDPRVALSMLLTEEAYQNLNTRKMLLDGLIEGQIAVFLPLPPHILDNILPVADMNMVFNTEEKTPPHVEIYNIPQIEFFDRDDLLSRLKGISGIVVDGQLLQENSVFVRKRVAGVIRALLPDGIENIFLHKIPHIPKGQVFDALKLYGETKVIPI